MFMSFTIISETITSPAPENTFGLCERNTEIAVNDHRLIVYWSTKITM
jgi:hypothetical protein